jgi:F-type H+-transporting ATPase subunit h
LYVKELKAFKPTPISTKDAESATRPWNTPVAPKAPALEVDAATQLSDYEAAEVEVQSNVAAEGAAPASDDWFVLEEPEDNHH